MSNPGTIVHRGRAAQLSNFSGLVFGRATPSDLDGVFDFGGKAFLFFELKFGDTPLPTGQRILLRNLVDAVADGGRPAVAMVARHDAAVGTDIDAGHSLVSDVYLDGRWRRAMEKPTLMDMCERFAKKYAPAELRRLTGHL